MTQPERPIPPGDLSLKYMAWDIKQISAELKAINGNLSELISVLRESNYQSRESSRKVIQHPDKEDIPF